MLIAFRTDASLQIGTGHVMRCMTLADELRRRGAQTHFISRHMPQHLRDMLLAKGHGFTWLDAGPDEGEDSGLAHAAWLGTSQQADAEASLKALSGQSWDWLVIDHYALDARWESVLRQAAKRILVIDDLADRRHDCDLLLDQNYYADKESRYTSLVPDHCQLLLGPRYALLREEFRLMREKTMPRSGMVKRVLIFLGGADADNYTGLSIAALSSCFGRALEVDVVIGAQHTAKADIEYACDRLGYTCHVQVGNMPELMAQADLAVGAGGTATWERCCLGLPTITLCVADNQRKLVDDSACAGLIFKPALKGDKVFDLRRHIQVLLENPYLRAFLSQNSMALVDGRGVLRVARKMGVHSIVLRLAVKDDSADLLSWRNHPSVREVSRNHTPITAEDHERWLRGVLRDRNRSLLIGYSEEYGPVGVVRFDVDGDCAEVSIYLVPALAHQGLGSDLLNAAEQWMIINRPTIECIRAHVLGGNIKSHGLFQTGGYVMESANYIKIRHRI